MATPAVPTPSPASASSANPTLLRENRSFALWPSGYSGALRAANAEPVFLPPMTDDFCGPEYLEGIERRRPRGTPSDTGPAGRPRGTLVSLVPRTRAARPGHRPRAAHPQFVATTARCTSTWPANLPDALQHRHPPERGLATPSTCSRTPSWPTVRRRRGGRQQRTPQGRQSRGPGLRSAPRTRRRRRGASNPAGIGWRWACNGIRPRLLPPGSTFRSSADWSMPVRPATVPRSRRRCVGPPNTFAENGAVPWDG